MSRAGWPHFSQRPPVAGKHGRVRRRDHRKGLPSARAVGRPWAHSRSLAAQLPGPARLRGVVCLPAGRAGISQKRSRAACSALSTRMISKRLETFGHPFGPFPLLLIDSPWWRNTRPVSFGKEREDFRPAHERGRHHPPGRCRAGEHRAASVASPGCRSGNPTLEILDNQDTGLLRASRASGSRLGSTAARAARRTTGGRRRDLVPIADMAAGDCRTRRGQRGA